MNRYSPRERLLATGLSALAGYVDAIAFIQLGGFFVSFMSGNTTRLGVSLAAASMQAAVAAGLIATFVIGVVLGSMTGRLVRGPRRRLAVLGLVSGLLTVAAAMSTGGLLMWAAIPLALAMGAENAVFEENGDVGIGVTYMTGALAKAGFRMAAALAGGDRWAWTPYVLLWLGLAVGGLIGAVTYAWLGVGGLWVAAGVAGVLAVGARRVEPRNGTSGGHHGGV